MNCRKNQATLTAAEKTRFTNALIALKNSGQYDQFVQTHADSMMRPAPPPAHRGPAFLPWHRYYLRQFELALQMVDPQVSLPYWDWSVDNSALSSIWGPTFLGGNGRPSDGQVMAGPFAFSTGNWPLNIQPMGGGPQFLTRAFASQIPTLPTPLDVQHTLAEAAYDVAPWNTASTSGFRNMVEGWINGPQMHNRVHVWVGGAMLPETSPNDPVFWLNHCFIDKLWADWLKAHPGVYAPAAGGPVGHNLNDTMWPWNTQGLNITPASVLDHHAMGYAYDTEPECQLFHPTLKFRDDVTLKFNDDATLKARDEVTLKFRDDVSLKFNDDATLKFRDDISLKFRDDFKLKFLDDGGGSFKFTDDPIGPGPTRPGPDPAPFILSTPHHSMAWAQSFPEAHQAAVAQLEQHATELHHLVSEMHAEHRAGRLSPDEHNQLRQMEAELEVLLRQHAELHTAGRRG